MHIWSILGNKRILHLFSYAFLIISRKKLIFNNGTAIGIFKIIMNLNLKIIQRWYLLLLAQSTIHLITVRYFIFIFVHIILTTSDVFFSSFE